MGWLGWSLRVGRIAGIDIKLHWSFVLVSLYALRLEFNSARMIILWSIAILLLCISVLLHELAHSLVARRFSIPTTHIIVSPFFGFARLGWMPQKPFHELLIAGAGPLCNGVIAVVVFLVGRWAAAFSTSGVLMAINILLSQLYMMNAILAVFNLIPAYPLDGGRMLRAGLLLCISERYINAAMLGLSWMLALVIGIGGIVLDSNITVITALLIAFSASFLNKRLGAFINNGLLYGLNRAAYYQNTENYAAAISAYNRRLATHPNDAAAYQGRGYCYLMTHEYQHAIADIEQFLQRNAENPMGYVLRSFYFTLLRDYDRAISDVEQAMQLATQLSLPYVNRGFVFLNMSFAERQYMQRAVTDFDQAIKLAPSEAIGYSNRGGLLMLQGDMTRALADFAKALACDARFAGTYRARAWLYGFCGDLNQALRDINYAIQLNPRLPGAYVYRSYVHYALGQSDEARDDCARALEAEQMRALVFSDADLMTLFKPQLAWALFYYDHALALRLDDALVFQGRADALWANGEHWRAIADYDAAIARASQRAEPYFGRARTFIALGEQQRAVTDLQRVLDVSDNRYLRRRAEELLREVATETHVQVA